MRLLVIHYSLYGHSHRMAQAVAEIGDPAGADGKGQPSDIELTGARFQGRHVAPLAARLANGN